MDNDKQLYILLGEIKATQELTLKMLADLVKDNEKRDEKIEDLNAKVNKAAAVLTLVTIFVTAVFQSGLKKLGLIS
jgi:hypothetical protein